MTSDSEKEGVNIVICIIYVQCQHALKRSVNFFYNSILSTNAYRIFINFQTRAGNIFHNKLMKSCSIHKYLSAIKMNCINCYNKLKY